MDVAAVTAVWPGWQAAGVSEKCALGIELHGVAVAVYASSACLLDRLVALLPPGWRSVEPALAQHRCRIVERDIGGAYAAFRIGAGWRTLVSTPDIDDAVEALEGHLSLYVAEYASPTVFVHAGVVGWEGGAIVVPGQTLSGKTTLVAALLAAGAEYYSDEFAVVGADGLVHPYARPLSLRPEAGGRPRRVRAETMGCHLANGPTSIHMVVATRYTHGCTLSPTRLSAGETVLELFANTVSARRQPAEALALLRKATSGALGFRGIRGEVQQAAESILDTASRRHIPA